MKYFPNTLKASTNAFNERQRDVMDSRYAIFDLLRNFCSVIATHLIKFICIYEANLVSLLCN